MSEPATDKDNRPVPDRFLEKIDHSQNGCWLWKTGLTHNGYGRFWHDGKSVRAHRFSYELLVGEIPTGLTLDHLCRVRRCVNPDHLEPVTMGENVLRGDTIMAANIRKTHCPQGHPYSGENLRITPSGGRVCRECNRLAQAAYKLKPGVKERYRRQRQERKLAYG